MLFEQPTRLVEAYWSFATIWQLVVIICLARKARSGGNLPRYAPGLWKAIALLGNGSSSIQCVPSHGKHPGWGPPSPHSGPMWRERDRSADGTAQAVAQKAVLALQEWTLQRKMASNWCRFALKRQELALHEFAQFLQKSLD